MGLAKEFKQFALKGNVVDLAVGVIIGAAFGKIVDSVVKDLIMPLVSVVVGNVDFTNLYIKLGPAPEGTPENFSALRTAGVPLFAYGSFLTIALNFVILAFIIFLMVKQMNRIHRAEPTPPPASTPEDVLLLREIRDSLKKPGTPSV